MNNSSSAGETGDNMRSQIKDIIDEISAASPAVGEAARTAKDRAVAAGKQVVKTVRRHPMETTIIAVGTGLLVWWLISRRSND